MFDPLDWNLFALILAGAAVTLINRLAGHYILARFEPIPYRVEAALEAVPIAVMTTLVVPAAINGGPAEWICLGAAMLLSLRVPFVVGVFAALALLLVLRAQGM